MNDKVCQALSFYAQVAARIPATGYPRTRGCFEIFAKAQKGSGDYGKPISTNKLDSTGFQI